MYNPISFALQLRKITRVTVHAWTTDQLITCIESSGILIPPEARLFVAFRGKFVNPELSLGCLGITEGSVVFVTYKVKVRRPPFRFASPTFEPFVFKPRNENPPSNHLESILRINDLAFNLCENTRMCPTILQKMLNVMEGFSGPGNADPMKTVIDFESKISEAPLPALVQ